MNPMRDPFLTWAHIDLNAIRHNFRCLKKLAGQSDLLPVIKADAYGHGMIEVAEELDRLKVKIFAVSDIVEGMELRRSGFKNEILLLESPLPEFCADILNNQLTPTVCSFELAKALNDHARARGVKVKIHVKVDTGMGRLGVWHEEAEAFIRMIHAHEHLLIDGIFTHFPLADCSPQFTQKQIQQFVTLLDSLANAGITIRYRHAANSMGLSQYRLKIFNLARPGLMLYGLYPAEKLKTKIKLRPAMAVKTHVLMVKALAKGRGVSYGHTFVAAKNLVTATLAIGYSDGYFRSLSNKAHVLIHGQPCPVIGNVTMDQIIVDVSKLKKVKPGDVATILGQDDQHGITAEWLAQQAGTINYEVVCNLGNRLPRSYS